VTGTEEFREGKGWLPSMGSAALSRVAHNRFQPLGQNAAMWLFDHAQVVSGNSVDLHAAASQTAPAHGGIRMRAHSDAQRLGTG